jgi:ribulose 1,5-bisphosphate synthetase/thiazole synthase
MLGTGDSGSFSDSDPVDYDLIIIGGDLSGLSAAWHYTHLAGADLPEENLRAYEEFA